MKTSNAKRKANEKYRETHKDYYKEYYKKYRETHKQKSYGTIYKKRLDVLNEYMTNYIEKEDIEPVIKEFKYLLRIIGGEFDE